MKRLRRTLLEVWIILPLAIVIGFMGPFGTYLMGDFFVRFARWWMLLMGSYVLVRPTMILWHLIARATGLPQGWVMFSGLMTASVPLALIWRLTAYDELRHLNDYSGLLPFAILCSLGMLVVVMWAEHADHQLMRYYHGPLLGHLADPLPARLYPHGYHGHDNYNGHDIYNGHDMGRGPETGHYLQHGGRPRLHARLSPQFEGDILALESEDHYVRVHGMRQSELLLMRLRDAIAEMDEIPGEQTHRSWWVARNAVAETTGNGRNREIRLRNGALAPVARDSVERLQRSGFLPA